MANYLFNFIDGSEFDLIDGSQFQLLEEIAAPPISVELDSYHPTRDPEQNGWMENYIRRHANDRDSLSNIENTLTESSSVTQTPDDKHLHDYIRRYSNDV